MPNFFRRGAERVVGRRLCGGRVAVGLAASIAGLLLGGASPALAARALDICSPDGAAAVAIVAVDPGFELVGADGRHFLPAGIEPNLATSEDQRASIAGWLVGHEVLVLPIGASPDRWGRIPAALFAPQDSPGPAPQPLVSLSEALVEAGFARAEPHGLAPACAASLLRAEDAARSDGLGLWADADNAVIAATDADALAAKAGTSVIAEGRVVSLGSGTSRFYLNFGPKGAGDLYVSILRRNAAKFDRAGLPLASLAGSIVRVRGLLENRFGPEIEVDDPLDIERVEAEPSNHAARL